MKRLLSEDKERAIYAGGSLILVRLLFDTQYPKDKKVGRELAEPPDSKACHQ